MPVLMTAREKDRANTSEGLLSSKALMLRADKNSTMVISKQSFRMFADFDFLRYTRRPHLVIFVRCGSACSKSLT